MEPLDWHEVLGFMNKSSNVARRFSSFIEVLQERALEQPSEASYTFLTDGEVESASLTFAELDQRARAIGAALQGAGMAGERVLLLYPPGLEFVAAFFGCLYGGAVAVPSYPPRASREQPRLQAILRDARPHAILTTAALASKAELLATQGGYQIFCLTTDDLPSSLAEEWSPPLAGPDRLAFLQYTSGSTATPKGVMVSHGNLLHNQEMIRQAFGQSPSSVIVGWLPLYHDMGLIGNVLQPLYVGARCILMSPLAFLQRPLRWLQAVSRYRATTSGGPNFAYDLCVRKIAPADREPLDLRSWTVAFNGAEPVRAETLERFAATFAPCGFSRRALYPCYGLAEATLFVSGGDHGRLPVVDEETSGASPRPGASARQLVGCGRAWSDQEILIVNPESRLPCPAGQVGEVWVAGPSVAQGYWNLPEETERTFRAVAAARGGPWLRTGDLGFVRDGELFISGRLRDLIILRGRNLYPQDVELSAERSHPDLRPGCGAAFSVELAGEERLVLVQEVERRTQAPPEAIGAAIRLAIAQEHEVQPYEVVLLAAGTIPKTSSGKIQRRACRELYLAGGLSVHWRHALAERAPVAPESPGAPALSAGSPDERRLILEAYLGEQLARILRLPVSRLDPQEPLTGFGIDSLAAVELQQTLETNLGATVGLVDLLQGINLRQLALRVLAGSEGEEPLQDAVPLPGTAPRDGAVPLSHGQRALWFLQRLQPSSAAYNIAIAADVRSEMDVTALRLAFELLARRHEALRLAFEETAEGPVQRLCPDRTVDFLLEDAAAWSAGEIDARLDELARRPFDLARDPLLRVAVLATPAGHTVLLVIHHIVADLWSLAVLLRDLGDLYPRLRDGAGELLPPPALRYADYVVWQNRRLGGEVGERLWAWWREQLRGELPVSDFPTDRPRPQLQTFDGGSRTLTLEADLLERLKALGQAHRTTLFSTLLAGFQVLLHRWSAQEDLLVGSPTAGRGPAALADLMGYFVNPVVVRADLAGRPSFAALLDQVRETVLGAFQHQDYPFPLLVERLQPERDASRSPLFQTMFVLERSHLPALGDFAAFGLGTAGARIETGGLLLESRPLAQRVAQLDLELQAAETVEGLSLVLIYNSDLFDGHTAERALGHLATLLAAAAAHPERPVAELPLLGAAERQQLLTGWNDTAAPLPDQSFPELFAARARRAPAALAVACAGRELTYGELDARSDLLARGLTATGLAPESRVVVWAERGIEFLTAMLAIWKAGGTYVPVDPRQPPRRLAQMVEQSGARRVLVGEALLPSCAAALDTAGSGGLSLLPIETLLASSAGGALPAPPIPAQLAYVLFTSGSTGTPKGVMIEHRGMLNHLLAKIADLGLTATDRIAQTAAPTFDISVWQFLAALLTGGTTVVLPDEVAEDATRLLAEVERQGITILETVPSLLQVVLQETQDGPRSALPALRWMIPTGEALPPELARQWFERFPRIPLLNAYGPSECSDDITHAPLTGPLPAAAVRAPIGRPVANFRLYVVDRGLGLLPAGAPGELVAGGAGVGRGYLDDPVRTAATFVPDPHSGEPGGRLYRTGDLGRHRPDGNLEFLGRLDHQVKIHGFRIELGEIEAVLAEHPGVGQAVVLARPDARGTKRLAAWWTPVPAAAASAAAASAGDLRDFLRQRLPEAMVPSAFVELAEIPLSAHGKVDRRALPEPDWAGAEAAPSSAGPRDEVEALLCGIFAEVLGRDAVGRDDHFFEAGGHSLLATQVMARVRQVFALELPLRTLFAEPTVASLAARVREARGLGPSAVAAPRRRPRPAADLPLSSGQKRLWFLSRMEPESPAYNMPGAVRLSGRLHVAALEASLQSVVDRHEALRTVFQAVEGEPFQRVLASPQLTLPVIDLAALPEVAREACAARLAAEESRRPFDLSRWPLLRTRLLRCAPDEHVLLVTLHHIVSDGWSQMVLVREISAFYDAFTSGLSASEVLPELPIQYSDYMEWQREQHAGPAFAEQLAAWKRRLEGPQPVLELPLDHPRPPRQTSRGARRPLSIPAGPSAELRRLGRASGATPFMSLLALFAATLERLTAQTELNLGTPVAGRRSLETEGLIGFFVNTLVLRVDLSGDPPLTGLLARVRETALDAYAHQDVPFERLVDELQPERDLSRSPLFQAMFILQNAPAGRFELPGLTFALDELDNGTTKFELTLSLEEEDPGFAGWIEYNRDLFDSPTLDRFSRSFRNLLEAALEAPRRPIAELPLLDPVERHQLLAEWNDTAAASALPGVCVHHLFEAQVARIPGTVAVRAAEGDLTYRDLDRTADRLARALAELGVGPDVIVGLCAERATAQIVGLLGILKAGGAYLPLDPLYPRERLAAMLEDSGAAAVVTEEALATVLPEHGLPLVPIDRLEAAGPEGRPALRAAPGPENLAYTLFTSGSTGRPKGVQVSHRALINFLLAMVDELGPEAAGGTLLSVTTLAFDIAGLEIFLPLLHGGTVERVGRDVAADGVRLAAALARSEAAVMQATPASWRLLLAADWPGTPALTALCGGEALPRELARQLAGRTGALWNLYGPTETTIWSAAHRLSGAEGGGVPIGRPIANTDILLLSRRLDPVPLGAVGEIYIGGAGLARGYAGRPDLTAERFLPHPAGPSGERLYRTGDLGRHLPDGRLEFLGRADQQVKLRGFRIEPEEIEAVLERHPAVERAVVLVQGAPGGGADDRRLVAWLAVPDPTRAGADELRAFLRPHLPDYMIPSSFVLLESLPLTPNGKVDRRALTASAPPEEGREVRAPRTATEQLVAAAWCEVLGVDRVGIDESFFALGGHSLLATRVVSRLDRMLGVELPVRALFEAPTVEALAQRVESELSRLTPREGPPLQRRPPELETETGGELPLSFAQERLWFLDQLEPGVTAYNVVTALLLRGRLAVEAFAASLTELVRRHEVLRTTFPVSSRRRGSVVQVIAPPGPVTLPVVDLSGLPEIPRDGAAKRLIREEAGRPFDLASGPLLRVLLLRLDGERHNFVINLHHIVADGWSLGVLTRELTVLYEAFCAGRPSPLPELPIQYADFALWQREWLQGEVLETQLHYWRQQLAGAPPTLDLPTDRPRPPVRAGRGGMLSFPVEPGLTAELQTLAVETGTTLFMVLLAGFQVVLGRYTAGEDITVGSPIANRNHLETEGLIGFFVNNLVLRTRLSGDPSFAGLLARVRETTLAAYAHQDLPFEKLVEALVLQHSRSQTPLFQVVLALQNVPGGSMTLPGLTLEPLDPEVVPTKFDWTVVFSEAGDRLACDLEYDPDLYDSTRIRRLAGHLLAVLAAAAEEPGRAISALPLLAPAERWQVLVEWNATDREVPEGVCVHHLVEAQVERTPEALAVVRGEDRLTYRELNERANRLAHLLRRRGVGPEVRVGIFVERSPSLVVSLLAVLKAGGAYVPLDPSYPGDRVGYMVEDARARVIVVGAAVEAKLPEQALAPGVHLVRLGSDQEEIARASAANPEPGVLPQNLSYIIYTSGSTGRPKGVAIQHRSVVSMLRWALAEFDDAESAVVLFATSISFDVSILELFFTLARGSKMVVAENILELPLLPEADEITMVNAVPSAIAELLRSERLPASVVAANVGGEPVPRWLIDRIYEHGSIRRVRNAYGPSENTTYTTLYPIDRWSERIPPVGRPIDNGRMYLLDPHLELLPVGVPGELYVGGGGVTRGYLDRPALTAEKFLPDPLSGQPGARMYRVGDIVRLLPDGQLEFIGRIDHQVKVRGFRIELGEIEEILLTHPRIGEVAVVVREDTPGDKRLVAYLTAPPGGHPEAAELRSLLAEKLPDYMIPAAFVFVDMLPKTPNGKIDRRTLGLHGPAPQWGAQRREDVAAPATPVEELLCEIWADVLSLAQVGVHDNFFALGGHSLLATQLVSRVRGAFGIDLPLRALFDLPTVANLAEEVEGMRARGAGLEAPPIERRPESPEAPRLETPLSFSQERLWFLDQLEPENPAYNVPWAVRLSGTLDVERLGRCFDEVVRRHEALRTTFAAREGRPVQVVAPPGRGPRPAPALVDLTCLAEELREPQARRLAQEEAVLPFDLTHGPLLRLTLVRLAATEHLLLLTLHHIVTDGWSMGVLVRELGSLYEAFAHGESARLPELPVQYPDFARWQREWLQGEVLESQLAGWRDRLAGAPHRLALPTDRPRSAVVVRRAGVRPVALSGALPREIAALCRSEGVTLFMTLLAAFATLLGRSADQEDLLIGSPIANRNRREIEDLIGFFVNTLVLRTVLRPGSGGRGLTFRELLRQVRQTTLDAYAHQDLPFERLVEELAPERDPASSPLFQVLFAFQNVPLPELQLPALTLSVLPAEPGAAKLDLTLTLQETAGTLAGTLEYDAGLWDPSTVDRLLARFETLLAGGAADPDREVGALPLLPPSERWQVLAEWNATDMEVPDGLCIHHMVEAQVERTPEALAVVRGDERLTYRELNERANRLAHLLRRRGVGPEVRVGIFIERSPSLVMSLLAVLKAGGAYVPLDPSYPGARLGYMVEDAKVQVILVGAAVEDRLPEQALAPGVHRIRLGSGQEEIARESAANPDSGVLPDNLSHVIYTSGSTGRPKGVAIQHRNAVSMLRWALSDFDDEESAVVVLATSISFDVSVLELFFTLSRGSKLVVAENILELPHLPEAGEITMVSATPSALAEMLRNDPLPASVLTANVGGEAVPRWVVDKIYGHETVRTVRNAYGPSENTSYTTLHPIDRWSERIPPLGRPIGNGRMVALDRRLELLPIGVPGELYVGGAGVARGYLDRPDMTAEKFLPDPFSGQPGARMYRVGDIVRLLPDGQFEFLGRIDHQVKVRGFRIELGEIEEILLAHPWVDEAAVVVREDTPGNKRLVAYLTAASDDILETAALRSRLAEKLPEHMIPAGFIVLDALPKTPSGKIDRLTLSLHGPAPEQPRPAQGVGPAASTGPVEELLARIWADVLGLDHVGLTDNFFDLGGHSLLATQVISRVRGAFAVDLPLRSLFETSTLAALAHRVADAWQGGPVAVPPLTAADRPPRVPLSFAQQRLWFLDRLEGESMAYHVPAAIQLEGNLDLPALAGALTSLVGRHEALRTIFSEDAQGPLQQVLPAPAGWSLPVADLSALDPVHQEPEARRLTFITAGQLFDLSRGPLLRTVILRLGPARHGLLVVAHHIVCDGWSMTILIREMANLYGAHLASLPAALPPLPVQYADYVLWQRSWLTGEVLDAELAYWREQLRGAPLVLELPTDRPRPSIQGSRGAVRSFHLPADLVAALGDLARRETATLFMALLAAFQVLLSRYSGQSDVSVGTPVAGRNRTETEGLIGLFVNTLVMRGDLSDDPSFRTLLARTREVALQAYRHQEPPFDRVVEELQPERSLSHTPLFQVMLILQNFPQEEMELEGLRLSPLPLELGIAKFDLLVALTEEHGRLSGTLEHNTDLFDAATAERLAAHFEQILRACVREPDQRVSRLPLLTPAERRQVLAEWNPILPEVPAGLCIHHLVEAQVARTPEALAVVRGEERLTYRELNERANRLAHFLRRLGVAPEERIGIFVERSPSLVVALLAVLKAGGAYVPLDPSYPGDRLGYMVEDAKVRVIVAGAAVEDRLPGQVFREDGQGIHLVRLGADHAEIARERSSNPHSGVLPENLSYVIYTSGSTGRPKGVAIQHRNAVSMLRWALAEFHDDESAVVLLATSVSFDVSVLELFFTLARGSKLVVAENILELPRLPEAGEITMINAVPSALAELLRTERLPASVLTANVGGEAVPRWLVDKIYGHGTVRTVRNASGPSETTSYATLYPIDRWSERIPPLGRPIGNTRMYALDARGELLPVGVPGELYVGGLGVSRGYLDRPALTAERFLPDPFTEEAGARMYKVGDIVRLLSDGQLEFLGRIDHQVKVRGFRIELGEIEEVLLAHSGIAEAAVVVREDSPGDKRLVAYLTAASAPVETAALRGLLSEKLPDYMIPSAFVILDALPKTPSGKIDRRTLSLHGPAPAWRAQRREELAAPATPIEETLCEIWADVLHLPRVGVHDSFFDLGGHSLLATQLISRVRGAFGVDLPLRSIFELPTVADLAAAVAEARGQRTGAEVPPIVRSAPRGVPQPLSSAQLRFWMRRHEGGGSSNSPWGLRISGPVAVAALESSLAEIVRRHEVLRASFVEIDGEPVQVVRDDHRFAMPVVDLAALPTDRRENELQRLGALEGSHPFDIAREPLLRATLIRLAAEEHALFLVKHHMITDGWSESILSEELALLYRAALRGEPSPLPELPIQYADFAVWERTYLQSRVLAELSDWWQERLRGLAPLALPTDRPRPQVRNIRGGLLHRVLEPELSRGARELGRREGVSVFMTFLTVWNALLFGWTGQDDITITTNVANRGRAEIERLIGLFTNVLALRTDLSGDPTFRELLHRVRTMTLDAFAHQELPFPEILQRLHPGMSYNDVFPVGFVLQTVPGRPLALPGLALRNIDLETGAAPRDLILLVTEENELFKIFLLYREDIFEASTIEAILAQFANLLAAAVENSDCRISTLAAHLRIEKPLDNRGPGLLSYNLIW